MKNGLSRDMGKISKTAKTEKHSTKTKKELHIKKYKKVHVRSKQFLYHIGHPSCYSKSSSISVMSVIEEGKHIRKREIHCHLRNLYFVPVPHFVITV